MQTTDTNRHRQANHWFRLGLAASEQKDSSEKAAAAYQEALKLNPKHLEATYNLAVLHHNNNDLELARLGYIKAIILEPQLAEAYKNLGDINFSQRKTSEAISSYQQAVTINPQYPEAWYNLGLAEKQLGHIDKALEAYLEAVKLRPNYTQALNSLAETSRSTNKTEDIITFVTKTLVNDNNIDLQLCLARLYLNANKVEESLTVLQNVTAKNPQNGEALNLSGLIYLQMGETETAQKLLRKACLQAPKSAKIHSNLLYVHLMNPHSSAETYLQAAKSWWQNHGQTASSEQFFKHQQNTNTRNIRQPLRLGFISADFCKHSVSYFFLPLIINLNPGDFQIFCYSDTSKIDDYTKKIKQFAHSWQPIYGLDHKVVAQLINDDKIDILIELSGHTANNRLPVIARQPAPLQFSWLGYPASSGIPSGTYRLTDQNVDPPENQIHYSEELAYLPQIFLCYSPPAESLDLPTTPKSAPENGRDELIFASFNNPAKINQIVVNVWSKILKSVPHSKLLIKSRELNNRKIVENFKLKFKNAGVNSEQIIFHPGNLETSNHFAAYQRVDIALDPFPYNGTTTTCEALWMGVPVIVLEGETHASRVGATLMSAVELPELIAKNEAEYIQKAIELSQDLKRLKSYKQHIREKLQASPLMNEVQFACDFTTTLKKYWSICNHTTPSIDKNNRIIKIAYLSSDFRDHPVAHNLVNLFRLHKRTEFTVYAYSCGPDDNSIYRQQIQNDCDFFVDLKNLTEKEKAARIKEDNIDILIELMGHTRNNCLSICALRPAPIQVTYLGYPGTTGADFIDFLIADKIVVPPAHKKYYSEQVIYLPNCFMIADQAPIGPKPTRQEYGLPANSFIFCSFNNAYKIEPVMFRVWMEILNFIPNSVLWLRRHNRRMVINLRNEAEKLGIAGERLIFADKVAEKKYHLARLQLANLYLDTRIYNGHTTTLDALWAGVPTITLEGQNFAARVSSSNLHNLDMPELITTDLDTYRDLAVKLAQEPQTLTNIREKLAANRLSQPLFDTKKTVQDLEDAYKKIRYSHTGKP